VRLAKTHDRPIHASRAGTVAALQQERSSSWDGDGDGDVDAMVGRDEGQRLLTAQLLNWTGGSSSADRASPSHSRAC
jgi:hypothetical protein